MQGNLQLTHDVERLPNGQTSWSVPQKGRSTLTALRPNTLACRSLLLDEDFQVTWAWDGFYHLDVNRGPILGEILHPGDTDQVFPPALPRQSHPERVASSSSVVAVRHDFAPGPRDQCGKDPEAHAVLQEVY
jgi:hypothetical protein